MKKSLLLALLMFLTTYCHSSENIQASASDSLFYNHVEEEELHIRQKPGTRQILAEMLAGVPTKSDTVYAVLYRPSYCRRCEAALLKFDGRIKQTDPEAETMLISVYKDSGSAKNYHEREGYVFDHYIYDTNDTFAKTLSLDMPNMNSSFVLKIRKSTGELIVGTCLLEMSDTFMRGLVDYRMGMPEHDFHVDGNDNGGMAQKQHKPGFTPMDAAKSETYRLSAKDGHPVSGITDRSIMKDGKLCFIDELDESIMVFCLRDGAMVCDTIIKPTESEKSKFIDLPKIYYDEMEANNELYYMPVFPFFSTDGKRLLMSYSMPYVHADYTISESGDTTDVEIEYYNKAVIIDRDLTTYEAGPMIDINIDMDNMDYFYKHFNLCVTGSNIIMGCQKLTWPMDAPEEYYAGNDKLDPFRSGFYKTDNPLFAVFDKGTGRVKGHFGRLESYTEKLRVGYAYTGATLSAHGNCVAYTDDYSGHVCVANTSALGTPLERYELFTVNADEMPRPDTLNFYKRSHQNYYNSFFDRKIQDVLLTDTHLYAFVVYGSMSNTDIDNDVYVFAVADRKTGRVTQRIVPRPANASTVLGYGMGNTSGPCRPFVIYRDADSVKLTMFNEDLSAD